MDALMRILTSVSYRKYDLAPFPLTPPDGLPMSIFVPPESRVL